MKIEEFQIDEDIHKASTLPGKMYNSTAFFEISREKIFAKTWQYLCDSSKTRLTESVFPSVLSRGYLDEPIVLTRDKFNQIHCLSNVCTHRGNILADAEGPMKRFTCNYHGRVFGLDGSFIRQQEFNLAENFPAESDHLPQVPFGEFCNLIFASIDPKFPFESVFDKISSRLDFLPFDQLIADENRSREYLVKANWTLYCENYLEGFHIPFIHPGLFSTIDFSNYKYEVEKYHNLQIGIVKGGEEAFEIPENHEDYGLRIGAYYFWVFPNLMLNFYPWGLSLNIVNPLGPELTKVIFKTYVWDHSKLDKGAGSELDTVEREDEAIVERVQRGVKSRLYKKGRFSPSMEKCVYHFHSLISEFCMDKRLE